MTGRGTLPATAAAGLLATLAGIDPALAQLPTLGIDQTGPRAVGLMALLAVFLLIAFRGRLGVPAVVTAIMFWAGLAAVLVGLYAYRDAIGSVGRETLSALVPGMAVDIGGGEVVVNRRRDGQFHLIGAVNDVPVQFLFDTGASAVVLTHQDAANAGIDLASLRYSMPVTTANGVTRVAPLRLAVVSVGSISATDVDAAVARPGDLSVSLLGMTFLDRLSGYQVSRNRLVLLP